MESIIDYSVIVPHRSSIRTLAKLLNTIPSSPQIEVIVVDNSLTPISKEDIDSDREFILLYSEPERGAGGARNVGIDNARGEWLIFADADDFFSDNAFGTFSKYRDTDAELICFCASSEYVDTGEIATRGDTYTKLVRDSLSGKRSEMDLRLCFSVPWSKMVRHSLVEREKLRYDEVVASNDMYFSLVSGYYANKILAVDEVVYVVTVSRGSLTRRRDKAVTFSKYEVNLRYNSFVKKHHLKKYQKSVMVYLVRAFKLDFSCGVEAVKLLFKYHQNPLVGCRRWLATSIKLREMNRREKGYIV